MDIDGKGSSWRHCCKGVEPHQVTDVALFTFSTAMLLALFSLVWWYILTIQRRIQDLVKGKPKSGRPKFVDIAQRALLSLLLLCDSTVLCRQIWADQSPTLGQGHLKVKVIPRSNCKCLNFCQQAGGGPSTGNFCYLSNDIRQQSHHDLSKHVHISLLPPVVNVKLGNFSVWQPTHTPWSYPDRMKH